MAKPTTELGQRCPPPPYTRWDQRGKPVLQASLKLPDGTNFGHATRRPPPIHLSGPTSSCPTNSTNGKLGREVSDVFTILDREGMAG
jgi:hypothetical protein